MSQRGIIRSSARKQTTDGLFVSSASEVREDLGPQSTCLGLLWFTLSSTRPHPSPHPFSSLTSDVPPPPRCAVVLPVRPHNSLSVTRFVTVPRFRRSPHLTGSGPWVEEGGRITSVDELRKTRPKSGSYKKGPRSGEGSESIIQDSGVGLHIFLRTKNQGRVVKVPLKQGDG